MEKGKKMSRKYRKVSLKKELIDLIEHLVQNNPTYSYKSIADFIEQATRKRLEELRALPSVLMLQHINIEEGGNCVTLWDAGLRRTVEVQFNEDKIKCLFCDSTDCRHVKCAFNLAEVKKEFERRRKLGRKVPREPG